MRAALAIVLALRTASSQEVEVEGHHTRGSPAPTPNRVGSADCFPKQGDLLAAPPATHTLADVVNEPCYVHDGACEGYAVCCVTKGTCVSTHGGMVSSNKKYYEGGCWSLDSSKTEQAPGCTVQGECHNDYLSEIMGGSAKAGMAGEQPVDARIRMFEGHLGTCAVPSVGGACFSADMTAQLESGETVSMKDLQLGDKVLTSDGTYSDVHLFSKRDAYRSAEYVVLKTATTELALSADHYVQSNGALRLARYVKVGDMLSSGPVTEITEELRMGAFSPITVAGDIVVNGVVASSYTKKVNPTLSHMLLAPRRAAYYVAPTMMNYLAEECTTGCDTLVRVGKMAKKALRAAGFVGVAAMIGGAQKA